jgi:hypothetical protein
MSTVGFVSPSSLSLSTFVTPLLSSAVRLCRSEIELHFAELTTGPKKHARTTLRSCCYFFHRCGVLKKFNILSERQICVHLQSVASSNYSSTGRKLINSKSSVHDDPSSHPLNSSPYQVPDPYTSQNTSPAQQAAKHDHRLRRSCPPGIHKSCRRP